MVQIDEQAQPMKQKPHFIVIGGMKCMTSTLHEQLARQPGICMSHPKEPCYFSNDEVYALGPEWYASLWREAQHGDLCGESSTHYTKLPTYPDTVSRIQQHCPEAKFIYLMRDPIDRLVSQYVHEWTMGFVKCDINQAITDLPILIDYSRYAFQLKPYFLAFGKDRILPVFYSQLRASPHEVLESIASFLGREKTMTWDFDLAAQNVGSERLRASKLRDAITYAPGINWVRKTLIPTSIRQWIKSLWRMPSKPLLEANLKQKLICIFRRDIEELAQLIEQDLNGIDDFRRYFHGKDQ